MLFICGIYSINIILRIVENKYQFKKDNLIFLIKIVKESQIL